MPFHSKPVLLDLFSGAGGAAMGYHRAGFEVVGVDLMASVGRRFPFEFHAGDWREVTESLGIERFDAIHASPPCQAYSITRHSHDVDHPQMIEPVREFLQSTGLPYVIENVPGSPLIEPTVLCGTMFDLTTIDDDGMPLYLKRHRLFESNIPLAEPQPCRCREFKKERGWYVGGVYSGASTDRRRAQYVRRGGYTPSKSRQQELMGIDWMTQQQLNQSIPPAYTEWIGQQLMAEIQVEQVA